MQIDSARELKQSLLKSLVQPLSAAPMEIAARAMSARPTKSVDPVQRCIALGVSHRPGRGYRLAVRIQTRSLEKSAEIERIVKKAKGEADVVYIGRVTKRGATPFQALKRPLLPGYSVGHFRITAGSLGCFVKTKAGEARILSNNHVLANENDAKKGDAILQPGVSDGGDKGTDAIGSLDTFVRLKQKGINVVDCALATIDHGIKFDPQTLTGVGKLKGVAATTVNKGTRVRKVGRTTGLTAGVVTAFELDNVVVAYDSGNARFDGQIEIEGAKDEPFSQGGDSGSLIIDQDRNALALLFAGGDNGGSNGKGLTYGHPIQVVFDALGVTLLS
jgi:hypothetical protein